MLKFLNKPSPYITRKERLIISVAIAVFVGAFLFVFEPFGVFNYLAVSTLEACAGFGGIVLVMNLFFLFGWNEWLTNRYDQKWTTWRQLVAIFIHVTLIALVNSWFQSIIYQADYYSKYTLLELMLESQFFSHSIAFMPIVFMLTYSQLKMAEHYTEQSSYFKKKSKTEDTRNLVSVEIELPEKNILLSNENFRFARAAGNYVEFFYAENGELTKDLQRFTLLSFESQIAQSELNVMKTHRSYIVNLDAVESISGNAQGFLLKLKGTEEMVPVSRNNIGDFKMLMNG